MRVTFVIQSLEPYGGQMVLKSLCCSMLQSGHDVQVVCLEDRDIELDLPSQVHLLRVHRSSFGGFALAVTVVRLRAILHATKPSVVISFMTYANLASVLSLFASRVPLIVTEHNVLSQAIVSERNPRAMGFAVSRLYSRVHAVVAVSRGIARDLNEHFGIAIEKIATIYNPVDITEVLRLSREGESERAPDKDGAHRIACVAALKKAKGHITLLHALKVLPSSYSLVLLGDGPERGALENAAREFGVDDRVEFLGWLPNPYPYVASANVLALPSLWEGFGLVAVEAAGLGVPVVASAVGGLKELIPEFVTGRLVPPRDSAALAEALQTPFLSSEQAARKQLSRFNPRIVSSAYEELIQGVLQERPICFPFCVVSRASIFNTLLRALSGRGQS